MIVKKPGMCWGGKIIATRPIENADKIHAVDVVCGDGGRWACVVSKELSVDDRVLVFMPDAIVPNMPQTTFMEKYGWKVRMQRLRGVPSEVLAVPYDCEIGKDYTYDLDVGKYEKEIPAQLAGDAAGNFPVFIPKTDEANFQTASEFVEALIGHDYYASVKYDGSSQTVYRYNGHVGGCSRNWELKNGSVWDLIRRYNLEDNLPEGLAVQWECIGPGIQKNPLGLKHVDCRVFSVFDIVKQEYVDYYTLKNICETLNLPMVDVVAQGVWSKASDDELRDMARGKYSSGKTREGIVVRPKTPMRVNGRFLSFKIINLDYKNA